MRVWSLCQSGMGGLAHLPFAGGAAEQPVKLLDAFAVLDRAAELLKPKESE